MGNNITITSFNIILKENKKLIDKLVKTDGVLRKKYLQALTKRKLKYNKGGY